MSIRVALIIPTMDRGGAEKQLALLAENLPRDEFDVHVYLLTRDGPRSQSLREAGLPVTVIGKRFKADPTALFRLKAELIAFRPGHRTHMALRGKQFRARGGSSRGSAEHHRQ